MSNNAIGAYLTTDKWNSRTTVFVVSDNLGPLTITYAQQESKHGDSGANEAKKMWISPDYSEDEAISNQYNPEYRYPMTSQTFSVFADLFDNHLGLWFKAELLSGTNILGDSTRVQFAQLGAKGKLGPGEWALLYFTVDTPEWREEDGGLPIDMPKDHSPAFSEYGSLICADYNWPVADGTSITFFAFQQTAKKSVKKKKTEEALIANGDLSQAKTYNLLRWNSNSSLGIQLKVDFK